MSLKSLFDSGIRLAASCYSFQKFSNFKFSGLAGKGAFEEAQVDAYLDQWKDFMTEIRPYVVVLLGFQQGDLAKLKDDVFVPAAKKHFPLFVNALKKSGSGYLAPSGLTFADLPIAEFIANLEEKAPELVDQFPELREHYKKVHSNPELKKWRETRPNTPF